VIGQGS
jgi:phospholipase A-2-activating protein